jgi:hypothetical protein
MQAFVHTEASGCGVTSFGFESVAGASKAAFVPASFSSGASLMPVSPKVTSMRPSDWASWVDASPSPDEGKLGTQPQRPTAQRVRKGRTISRCPIRDDLNRRMAKDPSESYFPEPRVKPHIVLSCLIHRRFHRPSKRKQAVWEGKAVRPWSPRSAVCRFRRGRNDVPLIVLEGR